MNSHFSLQSLPTTISVAFFSFTTLFSIFSLFLFILRIRPWCNCEHCRSYLSCTWAKEFENFCDWYTHLLRKSPTGTIHVHVLSNIVTANPENVEYILTTRFENYPKGKQFSSVLGDLLGRGIFNVDGEPWRFQRKMASLELGSVSVRNHAFEIVASEIESRLIPVLESENGVLDLQDVFRRFSFDCICRFSFGVEPGSMGNSEYAVAFDLASRLCAERAMYASPLVWKVKRAFNFGSEKKLKEAIGMVNALAEEMIRRRRQMGVADNKDLLSRFMTSMDDDRYLRDIVVSFLLAGRDTVASALTSFFWLLSQHPEVESKILDESNRVMGPETELATIENLREMHYLHAAVYENLRLFPPVQFDSKFAEEDDVLPDGTFVQKGSRVTYHPYAMGRMELLWGPDCLQFNPERWLKNDTFSPENPFKFPVFQAGHRVCLGKEMAVMEVKSVAVAIVRKFRIRVVGSDRVARFSPGFTASWKGGLPVHVQERTKPNS